MDIRNATRTLIVVAALLAFPLAAPAAEEPEAVYAKMHNAALAANYDEMRKYGTTQKADDMAWMPAWLRQPILRFLAGMLPKTYTVAGKTLAPDGNGATLRLTATTGSRSGEKPETVNGTVTLVKEKSEWKVDEVKWGGG